MKNQKKEKERRTFSLYRERKNIKKCIKIKNINNIYIMNPEEQKVLNQMYVDIQRLLKDVDELKTYKTQSEMVIRSLLQTNSELKSEIDKLKSEKGSERTLFTQSQSNPVPNLFSQAAQQKDLFRAMNSIKKP